MKNLPVGISTLATILDADMAYVDKSAFALRLASVNGRYFLSRPRRFGKSLFLDTLKSLFEGQEALFRDLYVHDKWDWSQKYPVIKIDFATGGIRSASDLELYLTTFLRQLYEDLGIPLPEQPVTGSPGNAFPANLLARHLIIKASEQSRSKVVVLIDEYDKPLLDNIDRPDVREEIRNGLRDFYSVIKEQDANLQFVFLTGVTRFSKVSIFSGINNLEDITLNPHFAAICGYTETDLDTTFAGHLAGVDRSLLKHWYNGYNFLGESVYNPFDILLFIRNAHQYRSWWFETGTPGFLVRLFQQRNYFLPELENCEVGDEILSSFDIENIEPATLLFQTGYLTIKETVQRRGRTWYILGFPNFEVKTAFNDYLINAYTDLTVEKIRYQDALYDSLLGADLSGLEGAIRRLFAAMAHRNYTNNDISRFEGYYASVLYAFFASIDCTVIPEDINNQGQADLTVQIGNNIFIMELKVVESAPDGLSDRSSGTPVAGSETSGPEKSNLALEQVRQRGYATKYKGLPGKRVFELGLVFGARERTLVQFAGEELS